jgi:23S rRNA pseudouridine1911/1915/1917 synthase
VGLLVFAKNKDFAQRFHQALADHQVEKRYYLLCQKSIPLGRHRHFMLRSPRAPKNVYQHEPTGVDSLNCELEVLSCKAQNEDIYAVEIRLLTGRTHQIRSQLAALGAPILGDRLYGSSVSLNKGFALQCYRLDFFKQSFTLPKEEFLKNLKFVAEEIIS